jgi:hypothetical protein
MGDTNLTSFSASELAMGSACLCSQVAMLVEVAAWLRLSWRKTRVVPASCALGVRRSDFLRMIKRLLPGTSSAPLTHVREPARSWSSTLHVIDGFARQAPCVLILRAREGGLALFMRGNHSRLGRARQLRNCGGYNAAEHIPTPANIVRDEE